MICEKRGFEMEGTSEKLSSTSMLSRINIRAWVSQVPLLGWLIGALVAVGLEMAIGTPLARGLGLHKAPALFGFVIMLKKPLLIPAAVLYLSLIYLLPIGLIARFGSAALNKLAAKLAGISTVFSILLHLALLYLALHLWSGLSDYRLLVVKLTLIAVMVIYGPGRICDFSFYGFPVCQRQTLWRGRIASGHRAFLFSDRAVCGWSDSIHRSDGRGHTFISNPRRLSRDYLTGIYVYR
jgi:hypothetical protein